MASLLEQTQRLYQVLNDLEAARPYLQMKNRDVEVRVEDETICIRVRDGRIEVDGGTVASGDFSVLQSTREVWDQLTRSRLGFTEAGGGMGGKLYCIDGYGSYTDMSWFGILTRLAQENRP